METDWISDELPPGFRVTASHYEQSEGEDEATIHMMISDGLANVSVFIEAYDHDVPPRSDQAGAANSFSLRSGDYLVTAVGEVPPATAEHIARSMQQK
jgi:sigma-E factor negative regulatory protein RseB